MIGTDFVMNGQMINPEMQFFTGISPQLFSPNVDQRTANQPTSTDLQELMMYCIDPVR